MYIKHKTKKVVWIILALLLLANIFVWMILLKPNDVLKVSFLNVGQGDAIFIEAPNGNQMLIDGGPNRAVLAELGRTMPFWDRSIDVILATHPDQDHIGGLPEVLKRYKVNKIIQTENASGTAVYDEFEKQVGAELTDNAERVIAHAGQIIWLGSDVYVQILFPDRDVNGLEANASSIVVKLVYGDTEFMLTGDSPQQIEKYLVGKYGGALHADVLKLGHHGSRTSSSQIFLSAVAPELAIISAGVDNRYGHPHTEVLDLLTALGIPSLSTQTEGTITVLSDGIGFEVKNN